MTEQTDQYSCPKTCRMYLTTEAALNALQAPEETPHLISERDQRIGELSLLKSVITEISAGCSGGIAGGDCKRATRITDALSLLLPAETSYIFKAVADLAERARSV